MKARVRHLGVAHRPVDGSVQRQVIVAPMRANLDVVALEQPLGELVVLIVRAHEQHAIVCAPQPRRALAERGRRFLWPVVREVDCISLDRGVAQDLERSELDRHLKRCTP